MSQLNINKQSSTLHIISYKEQEIYLLGTAHISQESANEIEQLTTEHSFDTIGIELDAERHKSITTKDKWEALDIFKVIKQGQAPLLMIQMALAGMQKRLGEKLNTKSGVDMLKGLEIQQQQNLKLALLDRSIKTTFVRAWRKSSLWQKNNILAVIFASAFDKTKIDEEELEKLKEGNSLDHLLEEMGSTLPSIKKVLIDERDQFLANSILETKCQRMLAVVGAGHVPGIISHIEKVSAGATDLPSNRELNELPPKSKWMTLVYILLPLAIVLMIVAAYVLKGQDAGNTLTLTWVLYNSIASGLLTLLAFPHPVAFLAAAVFSPITSLIPVIGVSFFSGLSQAWFRKPQVADFQNLSQNIESFKGWYKNKITRIFLVMILSTLGSLLGGLAATAKILQNLPF